MSLTAEVEETVEIVEVVRSEGTVVVLEADDGRRIAVDHRIGAAIAADLDAGESVSLVVEGWEFL